MQLRSALPILLLLPWTSPPGTGQEVSSNNDRMPDWLAVQGEYTGDLTAGEKQFRASAQIVAVGDDRYRMTLYQGQLPGGGDQTPPSATADSQVAGDTVSFDFPDDQKFMVDRGRLVAAGSASGVLRRVERKSDTLGMSPPHDAIVLFDGGGSHGFTAQDGGDPVVDGLLRQGIISTDRFRDFQLHIEFRLPFEPARSGQARGNSGVYLQGRYEVQMLDSFGLSGEHNECGGIYSIRKPDVNMCFPPETWQTYDIDFTAARWNDAGEKTANARITVRHNGVLIHDDVEVPKTTTAAPLQETPEPGYLYLQDHGSPVRYRNIWIVEK